MSSAAVGAKYGVDPKTVIANLKARGIEPREAKRQTVITGHKLEEAIQLRGDGWTYKQIGEHFGVSRATATNALKQADQG
jgi:lambda repressor-like predicted transcriptional regulator